MDQVKSFFETFKERISNPLISSFIIAWLVVNWKITIGLLFYNIAELNRDGYISYIDLISKNSCAINTFVIPLAWSLFYTFIYPRIKGRIKRDTASVEFKTDEAILEENKEAVI